MINKEPWFKTGGLMEDKDRLIELFLHDGIDADTFKDRMRRLLSGDKGLLDVKNGKLYITGAWLEAHAKEVSEMESAVEQWDGVMENVNGYVKDEDPGVFEEIETRITDFYMTHPELHSAPYTFSVGSPVRGVKSEKEFSEVIHKALIAFEGRTKLVLSILEPHGYA